MFRCCNKCFIIKNLREYYAHKAKMSGFEHVCKMCTRERQKLYYKHNSDKVKNYQKTYIEKNKSYINERVVKRNKEIISVRLASNLRKRINCALKKGYKSGSAVRDLGCSIEFLKQRLELMFQPNMTWDNYGVHGWHIDHIKPLTLFDLTDREQFLQACHYTNLQPLWAIDNIKKSDLYAS